MQRRTQGIRSLSPPPRRRLSTHSRSISRSFSRSRSRSLPRTSRSVSPKTRSLSPTQRMRSRSPSPAHSKRSWSPSPAQETGTRERSPGHLGYTSEMKRCKSTAATEGDVPTITDPTPEAAATPAAPSPTPAPKPYPNFNEPFLAAKLAHAQHLGLVSPCGTRIKTPALIHTLTTREPPCQSGAVLPVPPTCCVPCT
ncbi:uncharacterized protein EV422DRAFT_261934 [Fimicolochytrium jonesii]|uniref:uncharacterized protein n=1 Tax=Fimicolochytrium jonesii TaxID=1396493 RepID=UPI0022FEDE13|nr:uncharacterized protein EV422DRAFT_261934 [Fimicolochytrium jonesii]KAI8817034.1 hypothetical protein EV422DRAFT_261934 [Fimicolochytrium jonesii]